MDELGAGTVVALEETDNLKMALQVGMEGRREGGREGGGVGMRLEPPAY